MLPPSEVSRRAAFAGQLERLRAVFASMPPDLAIPYLQALETMGEAEVARMVRRFSRQRAAAGAEARRKAAAFSAQSQATPKTGAQAHAAAVNARDSIAALLVEHGAQPREAERMAIDTATRAHRG